MLPPRSRLLEVMNIIDGSHPALSRTDRRYPQRRNLERATQAFVTYLLVAGQLADDHPQAHTENAPWPAIE